MSFLFNIPDDPDIIPLPPGEVRIRDFTAEPYPDGRRVRVNLDLTPFQQRPSIEVIMQDQDGEEVASVSVVEPMNWRIEFTMHVRRDPPRGKYSLVARLYYPDIPDNDRREIHFSITD